MYKITISLLALISLASSCTRIKHQANPVETIVVIIANDNAKTGDEDPAQPDGANNLSIKGEERKSSGKSFAFPKNEIASHDSQDYQMHGSTRNGVKCNPCKP
jgi:hypothetical protein